MRKLSTVLILFTSLSLLLSQPLVAKNSKKSTPRNVIFFIGDGMGPQEIGPYAIYRHMLKHNSSGLKKVADAGEVGICDTHSYFSLVTDSAAAVTALATGYKTRNGIIGLDPHGNRVENVLEAAQKTGRATGVISTCEATHATPAGFYSHIISRWKSAEIAEQFLQNGKIDVLMGGGIRHWIPKGSRCSDFTTINPLIDGKSGRRDNKNLLNEAKKKGYDVLLSKAALNAHPCRDDKKILGLFSSSHLPFAVDRLNMPDMKCVNLLDMVKVAVKKLEKRKKGFFLMIEAGRIDHAGHANDISAIFHEIEEADNTVSWLLKYAQNRKDTLLLVTADHETGGPSYSYKKRLKKGPKYLALKSGKKYVIPKEIYPTPKHLGYVKSQTRSFEFLISNAKNDPKRLVNLLKKHSTFRISEDQAAKVFGSSRNEYSSFYMYSRSNPIAVLAKMISDQTFVVWSTGTHTSTPVFCLSYGPSSTLFKGYFQNVHIPRTIFKLYNRHDKVFPIGL